MTTEPRSTQIQKEPVEVKQRVVIRTIIDRLEPPERAELIAFFEALLERRSSPRSLAKKVKEVLTDARLRRTAILLLDRTATELKDLAWDDRTWAARLGLTAAAVTAIPTAGQGAGIAALGTAIGVPLWVVFGAGGAFAGAMIEELKRSLPDGRAPGDHYEPGAELVHVPEAEYELLGVQIDAATEHLVQAIEEGDEANASRTALRERTRRLLRRGSETASRFLRRFRRD